VDRVDDLIRVAVARATSAARSDEPLEGVAGS
jgi:hypothetical protein